MDRLHSMRVFSRVVDEGSFARAARELNLSPAVVTRLVADLEEHLGSRLINRTTRRLSLTDTGELYLERVRHILTEVEEAETLASAATAEPRGHLRVLSPPAFAVHQIAKHLPKPFAREVPARHAARALGARRGRDGRRDDFDVTILTEGRRPLDGSFVARRLARSEVIVLARRPSTLDAARPAGSPAARSPAGHDFDGAELPARGRLAPRALGRRRAGGRVVHGRAFAFGTEHRAHRHDVRRRARRAGHYGPAVLRCRGRAARERARARAAAMASAHDHALRRRCRRASTCRPARGCSSISW